MNFTDQLRIIAKDFPTARFEPFKKHPLADQIRNGWPASIKELLGSSRVSQYQFDASPGLGQWSEAPWLAVLHPTITQTAMAGFYPVYLFEPGFKTVCLVMGQGAQNLTDAVGKRKALAELARRAQLLRDQGGNWNLDGFIEGPFLTLKDVSVAKNADDSVKDPWSISVAFGKRYQISHLLPDDEMANDLVKMLDLYDKMAEKPGLRFAPFDKELVELKDSGELPGSVDGAKKVIEHKKFEKRQRNRKLIAEAKKKLGFKCQACTFSFAQVYGDHMAKFIEAHHKVPLSQLPDEGAELTPTADDFMVLCSNCHRAIHRAGCPDLEAFKKSIHP